MRASQVICTKWGTKFPASDVNQLYRMVRRNLGGALSFWCVTDDARGLLPEIQPLALPEVPVVGHRSDHGWRKLALFAPALGGPAGPTLYLDLDVAITASLEPFFAQPGGFHIIKDYRPVRLRNHYAGNSSVFRYDAGTLDGMFADIIRLGASITRRYRNEQEYLSDFMRRRGDLAYWPREWCVSFKHDCVRSLPFGLWSPPRLPAGARVVVFHGRPKPSEAVAGAGSKWYRPLRPAPWLTQYLVQ
ncbi:MAG TPA: glycosyltransferase [Steroidobacteraceae bacterium]|nr:glycosyltransferase [Steroidobacteraceae bacterium]